MYVIYLSGQKEAAVIDPGETDPDKLLNYFKMLDIYPKSIILTHEHFDHCAGINILKNVFDFQLYVSEECAENIRNSRRNLSFYVTDICAPFEISHPVTIIADRQQLEINRISFTFIKTPGHSKGSICIQTNNFLFSGDTLLESKVPIKLPGGNKIDLKNSLQKLHNMYNTSSIQVYPGHGNTFSFK